MAPILSFSCFSKFPGFSIGGTRITRLFNYPIYFSSRQCRNYRLVPLSEFQSRLLRSKISHSRIETVVRRFRGSASIRILTVWQANKQLTLIYFAFEGPFGHLTIDIVFEKQQTERNTTPMVRPGTAVATPPQQLPPHLGPVRLFTGRSPTANSFAVSRVTIENSVNCPSLRVIPFTENFPTIRLICRYPYD